MREGRGEDGFFGMREGCVLDLGAKSKLSSSAQIDPKEGLDVTPFGVGISCGRSSRKGGKFDKMTKYPKMVNFWTKGHFIFDFSFFSPNFRIIVI